MGEPVVKLRKNGAPGLAVFFSGAEHTTASTAIISFDT